MTITTKAALADELAISRARVSQYVKAGLPVRPDGKLNRDEALNWLRRNAVGLNTGADRGVNRAERLAAPTRIGQSKRASTPVAAPRSPVPPPTPSAEDEAARLALVWAFRLHARIVATSVLEAGGSMEVAYAAARIAHSPTIDSFTLALRYLGHPEFQGDDADLGLHATGSAEPDWTDLARRGGLRFDRAACDAHLAACPVEDARFDAPDTRTFETDFTLADLVAGTPYGEP